MDSNEKKSAESKKASTVLQKSAKARLEKNQQEAQSNASKKDKKGGE